MSSTTYSLDASSLLVRDVQGDYRPASADEVLKAALWVVGQRVQRGAVLTSPQAVRDFLRVKLGALEHEVFAVLLLDAQNRLIEYLAHQHRYWPKHPCWRARASFAALVWRQAWCRGIARSPQPGPLGRLPA
jgi:hypothetical protein